MRFLSDWFGDRARNHSAACELLMCQLRVSWHTYDGNSVAGAVTIDIERKPDPKQNDTNRAIAGDVRSLALEALRWARLSMLTAFAALIVNVVVLLWLLVSKSD
jgi:hypothetical protein